MYSSIIEFWTCKANLETISQSQNEEEDAYALHFLQARPVQKPEELHNSYDCHEQLSWLRAINSGVHKEPLESDENNMNAPN